MKYILSKKLGQLYLTEYDIFKLNYNCPADEKTGEGKGSCGGGDKNISEDRMVTVDKIEVDAMNGKFGDKGSLVIMTTQALRSMIAAKSFNSSVKGSDINGLVSVIVSKNPKSVKDAVTIARKVSPKSYFEKDNIPDDRIKKSPVPGSKVGTLSSPKSLTASQKDKLTKKLGVDPSKYKVARIDNGSGKQIPITAPITMFEDKKIQHVTENIPSGLMTKVSSITFSDGRNSQDSVWSERFGRKFTSGGNCDRHKGIVTLFGSDMKTVNSLKQILYHELGHTLDKGNKLSYSKEYGDAVREDTKNGYSYASFGGMGFVSEYAKASAEVYSKLESKRDQRCEDFADAIEMYINKRDSFSNHYPARYKYFKKLLGE